MFLEEIEFCKQDKLMDQIKHHGYTLIYIYCFSKRWREHIAI